MDESLTPMQSYCLASIRREWPLMASVLKSDCRTLAANGVEGLDENRVFRTLDELERLGLIQQTLGGYGPVYAKPVTVKSQLSLFGE